MSKYSCWSWAYRKGYYLMHPWKWFKELGINIKAVYMRAKYGFCYSDIWNWDNWFLHVTPPMLRYIAEYGSAYPGHEPFDTPEKWHNWLHEMADLLETGLEDWQDKHNEYYEEYIKHLTDNWEKPTKNKDGFFSWKPRERTELDKKYFERNKELAKQGEDNVRRVLAALGEHFFDLWD